ncbi:MAG: thioredoxin family protein [Hydrogenophaga sp.]|nr:thioredoxin family protein [Hydrogenophaga sp.]
MNTSSAPYATEAPTRAEVDALPGVTVLEFGTDWCGFCRAAQPHIRQALAGHPGVRHLKVEDGSGRPLGRAFGVKLWPTLVFLQDGQQQDKLVRPGDSAAITQALQKLTGTL